MMLRPPGFRLQECLVIPSLAVALARSLIRN
jgi:hypothetical protein